MTFCELDTLLDESPQAVQERERVTFDQAVGEKRGTLVLFGAGGMGRRILTALRRSGITPVAFSDNNPAHWGGEIEGVPILSPADAAAQYGRQACFVVTIWNRDHTFADTRAQLQALGCETVVSFIPLYWKYQEDFSLYFHLTLPSRVLAARDQVREAMQCWGDEASREEYLRQLRWRVYADHEAVAHCEPLPMYFPPCMFSLRAGDVLVDVGAYDGDTVRYIVEHLPLKFGHLHAIEPDPLSCAKLREYCASFPDEIRSRITIHQYATSSHRHHVRFSASGTSSSMISSSGEIEVECLALDDLLTETEPAFVKMDIEGAEEETLLGMRRIIQRAQPILAISVYHRAADLWDIPLMIRQLSSEYTCFLRTYYYEGFESVCYAVPHSRLPEKEGEPEL